MTKAKGTQTSAFYFAKKFCKVILLTLFAVVDLYPFFDKKIIFKKIFRNFKIFVDNTSILVYIVIVNDNHYQ